MSLAAPRAVPVDGEPFRAELIGAEADWRLTFRADGQRRTMPAADLVRWGHCPEQGRAGGLLLADGGWIAAHVATADRQKLTADSDLFGTFSLPLESLAGVVFHSSPPPPQAGGGRGVGAPASPLPLGEGRGVGALLKNGDELTGPLIGIADNVVRLQTGVGTVEIPTNRITAIILPTKPRPLVAPVGKHLRTWVGLSDGSRLLAARLAIEGGSAAIDAAGRTWKTSAENIVFLQPLGGRAVYLSDLKPVEYRQAPYLDLPWPYHADRNATGGRLRSGGQLYLKGIGVHSASRLVFSPLPLGEGPGVRAAKQSDSPLLPGEKPGTGKKNSPLLPGEGPGVRAAGAPKRFQALVGIDDSTDGRGSVRFRVLVDGRERYVSPILRGGDPPVPVLVELTGAKRLELVVDYADRADVLDHADWLDARLVR
ncbi:MAG: NPCBM/NEW2 domain-containing protein [Pirellulales bacterium]|nr:NPCBM/NEW2 domain-containing protein [Pirellulales bacterium]